MASDTTSTPTDCDTPLQTPSTEHQTGKAEPQQLSKNQLKKLCKHAYMLEISKERKLKEKELKRAKAVADGRDLQAEHQFMLERTATGDRKRRNQERWDTEKMPLARASFQICVDCAFEKDMTGAETASLAKQLRYCYSYNKNSPHPCLWSATSMGGVTLQLLQKEIGFSEWSNRAWSLTDSSLEEYYENDVQNVVYLTSDSDNTITDLDNSKIYVIGGIVDRNRLKGVAMNRAIGLGVATAKLPLDEHLAKMPATRVLTCNHVFDILLKYREYGNDWAKALQEVLPSRKDAEFKVKT